jgi:hypothetical protein
MLVQEAGSVVDDAGNVISTEGRLTTPPDASTPCM